MNLWLILIGVGIACGAAVLSLYAGRKRAGAQREPGPGKEDESAANASTIFVMGAAAAEASTTDCTSFDGGSGGGCD